MQVYGEWYYLNELPVITKSSSVYYEYNMVMQSAASMLDRVKFLSLGDDNSLKEPDFSLMGNAQTFVNLILQNLRRLEPDFYFTYGEVFNTDYKNITFEGDSCLSALSKVSDAFGIEYIVEGTKINLTNKRKDTGYEFRHGQHKGMYEVVRKNVDSTRVVTRIYPFGADKNLPEGYRNYSKRLKMAPEPRDIVSDVTFTRESEFPNQKFTFNWTPPNIDNATGVRILSRSYNPLHGNFGQWGRPLDVGLSAPAVYTIPSPIGYQFKFQTLLNGLPYGVTSGIITYPRGFGTIGQQVGDTGDVLSPELPLPVKEVVYLEKNIEKYGVSEDVVIFDDIYPHRTGKVSSINAANPFEFIDSSIDFNLNDYLLPGMTAKVTFNTGQLSGYTFEISEFDNSSKKVVLLKSKNERTIDIPSYDLRPAIGDQYVFTDISMPQTYVDAAEELLKAKAKTLLGTISEPQLAYQVVIDPTFIRQKKWMLDIGYLIWVIDRDFNIQRRMRVTQITRKVVEEYSYEIEIADAISKGKIESLISGQQYNTSDINNISNNLQNNSILNNRVVGDLIMTGACSIKFENIPVNPSAHPVGIGDDGKLYRI